MRRSAQVESNFLVAVAHLRLAFSAEIARMQPWRWTDLDRGRRFEIPYELQ